MIWFDVGQVPTAYLSTLGLCHSNTLLLEGVAEYLIGCVRTQVQRWRQAVDPNRVRWAGGAGGCIAFLFSYEQQFLGSSPDWLFSQT